MELHLNDLDLLTKLSIESSSIKEVWIGEGCTCSLDPLRSYLHSLV